jgi:hypothetical protein
LIVNWPGHLGAHHSLDQLCGAIDLTPTLCELVGIPIEPDPNHPLDGLSLAKKLRDPNLPPISRSLFSQWGGRIAMRQDGYLLDSDGALFDLLADPRQQTDRSLLDPKRAEAMGQEVQRWRNEVFRSAIAQRPFPVGHPERTTALLPAQDGKCQGPSVRRSDTAPNCSYFKNIRATDDVLSWDIEPLQPGRYSVWIHYAAPEPAVGKEIRLKCSGREVVGKIVEAFESPLRGASNDRVPRKSESLMKDFGTLRLGTLELDTRRTLAEVSLVESIESPSKDNSEKPSLEIQALELRLESP